MDRRTFLVGALFSIASSLSSQVLAIRQQQQTDRQQDLTTTSLLADQKSLAKEQTDLNKAFEDIPDLAPVAATQDVLLRLMSELLATPQLPYTKVMEVIGIAQQYILSGGDATSETFWEEVYEYYIKTNSDNEATGKAFLTRLTAL